MSDVMQVQAPAKINLHLRVAPVNGDGFHPLCSWMCTVGLFDTLSFEFNAEPLSLSCDDPTLACDESNLVIRAARAIGQSTGTIRLQKRIPTGGGLGGGSSDAAHTLMAINQAGKRAKKPAVPALSPDQLAAIAATLGSDVAFFCHGPSSICTGRGEIVRPISPPTPRWALLILPSLAVPTGPVYRRFDELLNSDDRQRLSDAVRSELDWNAWTKLSAEALLSLLVNDLERPAFDLYPALARCRAELEQFLGRIVRMSGSGSSLFTLYDEQLLAERAAATLNHAKRSDGITLRVLSVPLTPEVNKNF